MGKTPYAVEYDLKLKTETILYKEDFLKNQVDTSNDKKNLEPVVPNDDEITAYKLEQGIVSGSLMEDLKKNPQNALQNELSYIFNGDNRRPVDKSGYGSNCCIFLMRIYETADPDAFPLKATAFAMNSVAVTNAHCVYNNGTFSPKLKLYHQTKECEYIELPEVKSVIVSKRYIDGVEDDDWAIITFSKKQPFGGMGIISTLFYKEIQNQLMALSGFPFMVNNYIVDGMWTEDGKILSYINEDVPTYTHRISSSGGNSGGPIHCMWPKEPADHKYAACAIHHGRGSAETFNKARAIDNDLANFMGKIAERENKNYK